MNLFTKIELFLNRILVHKAPALPDYWKYRITRYLVWVALLGSIASLWAAWAVYQWVNLSNSFLRPINDQLANAGQDPQVAGWSVWLYLSAGSVILSGLIYLLALWPLAAHRKFGWNLMVWSMFIVFVHGAAVAFSDYGHIANLAMAIAALVVGLYLLFQVRAAYAK